MRTLLALSCLALATACGREPSFDERYEAQAEKLDATANGIEAELGRQLNASVAAGRVRTDPNAPAPLTNRAAEP